MAQRRIGELPAVTSLSSADLLHIVQSSLDKQGTLTQLERFLSGGTLVSANTVLSGNKKYKASGVIDLTLPSSAAEGDRIEIFSEDMVRILQSDAQHGMSYLNKWWTTKGTAGYLQLKSKNKISLQYKGNGNSKIDPGLKLADPATLPAGGGNGCAFSADGNYLAVAHTTTPFITIYKRSGDTFTKLANPATLPTGTGNSCAFSADGNYLAVVHGTTPCITIYKRSGDTFAKLANPATLPTSGGNECAFSADGNYLAVANGATPFITIYDNVEDITAAWLVEELNTLYSDDPDTMFK